MTSVLSRSTATRCGRPSARPSRSSSRPDAPTPVSGTSSASGPSRVRGWSASPCGAPWWRSTGPWTPGPPRCGRRTPLTSPTRRTSWPSASTSSPGCSGSSTSSWPVPRPRPWPRGWPWASWTTSPSECTRREPTCGPTRRPSPPESPWVPRRTCTTSRARTGPSHRGTPSTWRAAPTPRCVTWCARSCVMPARCAWTTSSVCSACGGFPRAWGRTTALTCATTTRPCSASSCWRLTGPALWSSVRTWGPWSPGRATTWPAAVCWEPVSCGSRSSTTAGHSSPRTTAGSPCPRSTPTIFPRLPATWLTSTSICVSAWACSLSRLSRCVPRRASSATG